MTGVQAGGRQGTADAVLDKGTVDGPHTPNYYPKNTRTSAFRRTHPSASGSGCAGGGAPHLYHTQSPLFQQEYSPRTLELLDLVVQAAAHRLALRHLALRLRQLLLQLLDLRRKLEDEQVPASVSSRQCMSKRMSVSLRQLLLQLLDLRYGEERQTEGGSEGTHKARASDKASSLSCLTCNK